MEEAHNQEVQKRKQLELRQEEERRRRDEELRAHTEELMRRQQGTGQNFAEKVHTHTHTVCVLFRIRDKPLVIRSFCALKPE